MAICLARLACKGRRTLRKSELLGLIKAAHFGPTVLVVTISILLSLTNFTPSESFQIGLAILFGQFVVGWTNDLVDYQLDLGANRVSKPLVAKTITESFLRNSIFFALALAFIFSLLSPFGLIGTALHFLGILSATSYNLRLKSTALSPLPYLISFGGMPWAIYLSNGNTPPLWLWLALALFANAFHFLNVLKDLQWDIEQNVLGLPQRLGRNKSVAVAAVSAGTGIFSILFLRNF